MAPAAFSAGLRGEVEPEWCQHAGQHARPSGVHVAAAGRTRRANDEGAGFIVVKNAKSIGVSVLETPKR